MQPLGQTTIILGMTPPATSAKVVLVADRRTAHVSSAPAPVRRYRLARVRFDGRASDPSARFEHLKRVYD
jgi:hypothetical protein